MSAEEWRPILGWEGLYEVSSFGRVKSLARKIVVPAGLRCREHVKSVQERLLAVQLHPKTGYMVASLHREGESVAFSVHVLVCAAFHGPRPPRCDAAHGDGVKTNNLSSNLRWATRRENLADKVAHGTSNGGEKNPNAKLKQSDVVAILAALHTRSAKDIALDFGVSPTIITRIKRGAIWRDVTSPHNFAAQRQKRILNADDVAQIKQLLKTRRQAEIAVEYGVSRDVIFAIKSGRAWRHVPG